MKKTTCRRLEILEREDLARKQRELDSLQRALRSIWRVIHAHYLGGLQLDETSPSEANARALKYPSADDYFQAILKEDVSEIPNRSNEAYRRLFAIAGLDFDLAPPADLFDAFVKFVNQLPDKWLSWLRSDLQAYCSDAKIAAGSNLPRQLTCDNFLPFEDSTRWRDPLIKDQALTMHLNWSPGIGDPTIGGWVTVALYLLTSFSCWRSAGLVRMQRARMLRESRAWRSVSCLFLALGINKQLDLQSALTEVGRILAQAQGWYAQREVVQLDFILLVAVACLIAAIVLVILVRRSPLSTWLALIGTAMVLCFVFIRAASFHHFDRFIGSRVFGLRWNWIVEMSGISLVLLASQWRQVRLTRVS